jgi:hypothetical protein
MKRTIGLNFLNFNNEHRPIIVLSVERMEEVVFSSVFFEILKDEISKSNGLEGELSKWKDASPEEIYAQLFPITLHLSTYYTYKSVYGYGYANDDIIRLNTKYLSTYKLFNDIHLMLVGSNLFHEHSHNRGFDHDFKNTLRRKNSLSYILNRAYERAYRQIFNLSVPVVKPVVVSIPWYKRAFRWF